MLTKKEWDELVTLDYILTWNYTEDYKNDENRHRELRKKELN